MLLCTAKGQAFNTDAAPSGVEIRAFACCAGAAMLVVKKLSAATVTATRRIRGQFGDSAMMLKNRVVRMNSRIAKLEA